MVKALLPLLLLGLTLALPSAAQRINFPCDPDASTDICTLPTHCDPDDPDACVPCDPDDSSCVPGDPFLECIRLYNHFNNGTCRCGAGLFWNPFEVECMVEVGNPCSSTEPNVPECTRNSKCEGAPGAERCSCDEGYYPLATGSYCVAGHDAACGNRTETWGQCDYSVRLVCGGEDPENRVCICAGEYIWSESRGKCLGTVQTTTSCAVDDDCVDNSRCSAGNFGIKRCACSPSFTRNADNACSAAFGAPCEAEAAPDDALACNVVEYLGCNATAGAGVCGCPDGREYDTFSGRCLGRPGDECDNPFDCIYPASCHYLTRRCMCSQYNRLIELPNRKCDWIGRAGGVCRLSTSTITYNDCNPLEYQECVPDEASTGPGLGRCFCRPGMHADTDGRCVQTLGSGCGGAGNQNCVPGAACIGGNCTCLPGTYEVPPEGVQRARCLLGHDVFCIRDSRYPDPCNHNFGLACENEKCSCPVGQEWNERAMHCVALLSGACSMSTHYCTSHASCTIRGVCECAPGYSQHSEEDRRCRASHGTICGTNSALLPCNDNQWLQCNDATQGVCACEQPQQQGWDAEQSTCASLVGGHCGAELIGNRTRVCVTGAVCRVDGSLTEKCVCDEDGGWVPDGSGRCMQREEDTTTTEDPGITTTTTTTEDPGMTTTTGTTTTGGPSTTTTSTTTTEGPPVTTPTTQSPPTTTTRGPTTTTPPVTTPEGEGSTTEGESGGTTLARDVAVWALLSLALLVNLGVVQP